MLEFKEIATTKIHDKRNLVVSKNNKFGGYTIAQQLIVEEGVREIELFIKGAIQVKDLNGLYNIRDLLNEVIAVEEEKALDELAMLEQI